MKLKRLLAAVVAGIMTVAVTACGGAPESSTTTAAGGGNTTAAAATAAASGEVYELSYSMHDGAQTVKCAMTQEWADQIAEKSGGRIHITIYPGGALAAQDTVVETVESGAADFGMVYAATYNSMFPKTNGIALPMLGIGSAQQATKILWEMHKQFPEVASEFDDLQVIHMYSNGPSYFQFVEGRKVDTFDGLKGMKIRSGGGTMTAFIEACGATPMSISTPELYESLEKGLVEGSVSNGSQMASWNLSEVEPYYLNMPLYVGVWLTIMNKDKFNSLPEDLQQILLESGGLDGSMVMAQYLQDENDSGYEDALSAGGEWIEIADAEVAKYKEAADGYISKWIQEQTSGDFDAQAYYDAILAAAEKSAE